jgi:hypothetical protein
MLISYPVLPARPDTESEEDYLNRILTNHVSTHSGRYPVSSLNTAQGVEHHWHGGLHLVGSGEPIRAIADGTVVAYRIAAQTENYPGQGNYDTSFVLLRHETQSGENTTVVFYSLYMHLALRSTLAADRLAQLPQWLRNATPGPNVQRPANQRVWRKEVLGFAGQLYNRETCHFEVFTTAAALNAFWRDSTTVTQGAGSADFFGDAHFVIPANQTFAVRHPRATTGATHQINFAGTAHYALPLGQAGNNTAQLFVSVRLEHGRRIATTYEAGPHDTYRQVGAPVQQDNYEYELYRLATALYPDCPSAGFEMLRFGRILSTDTTTRNENWQLVRYSATAVGYINLAPQAVAKLSDADFVHWQGWEKHDEGSAASATDSVCDDAEVVALSQATADADSQRKLRHFICKHPSEWDAADLATRFARFREPGQPLQVQASWDQFEQHVQKMAFWANTGLGERSVWHFHPLQFVYHYRKCGWLSSSEMKQMVPNHAIRNAGRGMMWEPITLVTTAQSVFARQQVPLNKMMRKHNIKGDLRYASFFGNAIQETAWFFSAQRYNNQLHENNTAERYYPWDGRGFLQLTWSDNYIDYWDYLGRGSQISAAVRTTLQNAQVRVNAQPRSNAAYLTADTQIPQTIIDWRNDVANSRGNDAAGSAGFYWAKFKMASYADVPHQLERVSVATNSGNHTYYRSPSFWRASAAVNLPGAIGDLYSRRLNGFEQRCSVYAVVLAIAGDDVRRFNSASGTLLDFPEGVQPRR